MSNRSNATTAFATTAFGIAISLGTAASGARAAPLDWRGRPYSYAIVNQSVADVLKNFGYNVDLRISISPDVSGFVHGRINATTAGEFLDAVTKANALDWYYDGAVMYISPASGEQTESVPLHGASFADIKGALMRSSLLDDRYTFNNGDDESADFAIIAGPPSYVAVIKRAIEAGSAGSEEGITIYRGTQSASVHVK